MLHDRKENSQNELDRATRDGETEPSAPDPTAGRSDAGANEVARHGALSARARYELVQECEALVVHVARHGDILNERDGLEEAYGRLLHRLGECGGDIPDSSADWPALVEAYAGVTRHTRAARGVSGRSVLDTWNAHGPEPRKWWSGRRWLALLLRPRRCERPLTIAIWLSALAFVLQVFIGWAGRVGEPAALGGTGGLLYHAAIDLLPLLVPAVCGAIGSCVFLMKLLSDKLSAFTYEEARLKGDGTRIFLGAILGVVVVMLFFPTFSEQKNMGELTFGPVATAFVAGFAVKSVYSAFERLVEGVAGLVSGRGRAET